MIKNIVFDLGNVLLNFNPPDYLEKAGYSPEQKNIILNDIFRSEIWRSIDNGDITTGEAIDLISEKSSLKRHEIASLFDLRMDILSPIHRNIKIVPALKKRGFRLYYLSNFPEDIFDQVVSENSFFTFFDGGLISARVKASKPGREIFEILFKRYSIVAEECLFIDDIEANVVTARSFGMKAIIATYSSDLFGEVEKELSLV